MGLGVMMCGQPDLEPGMMYRFWGPHKLSAVAFPIFPCCFSQAEMLEMTQSLKLLMEIFSVIWINISLSNQQ
jgi:hypothetical protein